MTPERADGSIDWQQNRGGPPRTGSRRLGHLSGGSLVIAAHRPTGRSWCDFGPTPRAREGLWREAAKCV